MRRPWPVLGRSAKGKKNNLWCISVEEKTNDKAGKDAFFYVFSIHNLVTVQSVITHAEGKRL
jgi:hypothetical protein